MTGRAAEFYGVNDVDRLFHGNPKTPVPWSIAPMSRTHRRDNPELVFDAVHNPERYNTVSMDPRDLYASQPEVVRAAAQHYMKGDYQKTGTTFADQHNAGNAQPVVFHDVDSGRNIIRSGHHRALTALLRGEQFNPLFVPGHRMTHQDAQAFQRKVRDLL